MLHKLMYVFLFFTVSIALLFIFNNEKNECFDTYEIVNELASCQAGKTLSFVQNIDGTKIVICRCNESWTPAAILPTVNIYNVTMIPFDDIPNDDEFIIQ